MFLPCWQCMARKPVAGVLLLAIAAWAELALAPMLAMPAGHIHTGHVLPAEVISQHADHHHAARATAKHACCPPVRSANPEGILELVADASGCRDSHRCCFRQGPQSIPAPVSEAQQFGSEVTSITATHATPNLNVSKQSIVETPVSSPPFRDVFGMTLRV